jgi:hypothetical protein
MANETLLNIPATIAAINLYTITATTLSATIVFDVSNTTWGATTPDENPKLTIGLGQIGTSTALSATSIAFTLSSATVGNVDNFGGGAIIESRFATNSAVFGINFTGSRDLLTTTLYLSANASTIAIDTTRTSVIDNFFYVNDLTKIRTTAGHSRLVSYLG